MKFTYFTILIFGFATTITYAATVFESYSTLVENDSVPSEDDFVLPEGIVTCSQDDPELNQCIKNAINHQLPLLHKGSKVLNIPPLDPLRIPDGRYEYSNGAIGGTLVIKGVNVHGVSKSIIKKVDTKISENELTTNIAIFFPRIFIEGNYKADVKINELKMRPKGFFNLTLSEMSVNSRMSGEFEMINGKKYLQLKSFDIEPEIGDFKIYATGLFPDPVLNSVILDFANQYWREIVLTIIPQTKPTWEPLVLESANKFLAAVPFEKLLTKNNN